MSIPYLAVDDQVVALFQLISSEKSPIKRIVLLARIKKSIETRLRELEYQTAWECRQSFAFADIYEMTGIESKRIDYLSRMHASLHPELPPIKRRQRVDVGDFMNLVGDDRQAKRAP